MRLLTMVGLVVGVLLSLLLQGNVVAPAGEASPDMLMFGAGEGYYVPAALHTVPAVNLLILSPPPFQMNLPAIVAP